LSAAGFSVAALLVIGAAGCLAGARMFRWDAEHRLATGAYGWVAVALSAWVAVGLAADVRGIGRPSSAKVPSSAEGPSSAKATEGKPEGKTEGQPEGQPSAEPAPGPSESAGKPSAERRPPTGEPPPSEPPRNPTAERRTPSSAKASSAAKATEDKPADKPSPEPRANAERRTPIADPGWRSVTRDLVDRDLRFDRLPADDGVIAPIARSDDAVDTDVENHLEFLRTQLLVWRPAQIADPLQRVRNVLFVAAVPDVFQIDPLERFIPLVVFDHLQQNIPSEDLVKILYWIALHPNEGDDSAVDELKELRLGAGPRDIDQARQRAALYAVKLLGRITGKLPQ
jgi:hypothetical protein